MIVMSEELHLSCGGEVFEGCWQEIVSPNVHCRRRLVALLSLARLLILIHALMQSLLRLILVLIWELAFIEAAAV